MAAVTSLFDAIARALPSALRQQIAVASGSTQWTYDRLFHGIDAAAGVLRSADTDAGPVFVQLPNSAESLAVTLGAMHAGRVVVPLFAEAGPERTRSVIETTRPDVAVATNLPALTDAAPPVPKGPADLLAAGAGDGAVPARPDAAMVLFSSGSTGRPKGIVLRHAGLVWTAQMLAKTFGFDASHRELIVCPLVHSGAWQRAAATLLCGGRVQIAEPPVSISGLLEDVAAHAITGFYTPPPLIRYLLKLEPDRVREALASLRTIEIGSAPMAAGELAALMQLLPHVRVYVHYGLTECSRATVLDASAHPERLDTVGRPLPGVTVSIRDASGAELPAGTTGAIYVDGPQRASGCWSLAAPRSGGAPQEPFEGPVATGDQGRLDADGFLTFVGRLDDRIDHAGFHFFPAEVEAALGEVPGVLEYVVAGVPDPRGVVGECPQAFVVAADPATFTPAEFGALARQRLPPYMVPRKIVMVDTLPKTPAGKPDRRRLVADHGQENRHR